MQNKLKLHLIIDTEFGNDLKQRKLYSYNTYIAQITEGILIVSVNFGYYHRVAPHMNFAYSLMLFGCIFDMEIFRCF